jgi:hypothetical protein
MAAGGFCPQCRTPRVGTYRYCASCGFDYGAIGPAGPQRAERTDAGAVTPALLAGIAWILSAVLMGYLALLQLGYANIAGTDLRSLALWNGLSAAITLYFGARMLRNPTGILTASIVWGVLTVAWNGYQIAQGATHEAYLGATVTAGAAAVLSWAARSQAAAPKAKAIPEPPAPLLVEAKAPEAHAEPPIHQPPAPAVPVESLSYTERFRTTQPAPNPLPAQVDRVPVWLYAALVLAALFVLAAIGLVLAQSGVLPGIAGAAPTARAQTVGSTPYRPAPTQAPAPGVVAMGQAVHIVCDGVDCMDVSVDKVAFAAGYTDPQGYYNDTPAKGDAYVAVHVTYTATGSNATYNPFDWAIYVNDVAGGYPAGVLNGPTPQLSFGQLPDGKTAAGWIVYEVPATGRVTISYQPGRSGSIFEVVLRAQ